MNDRGQDKQKGSLVNAAILSRLEKETMFFSLDKGLLNIKFLTYPLLSLIYKALLHVNIFLKSINRYKEFL